MRTHNVQKARGRLWKCQYLIMTQDLELRLEVDALRAEVKELKEFVRTLYSMMVDEDEYDASDFQGGIEIGRFNT